LIVLHQVIARRRFPWKMVALYLALLLPWGLYATWTYGSPIPATLSAKQAQGRMAMSDSYLSGAWRMLVDHLSRWRLYWLYLPLGAIGVWQIARRSRTWWMLLAWTAGSFLAYVLLGVSRYFWYYVPLVPGILVPVAAGVGWLYDRMSAARWGKGWRLALTLVLVAGLLWPNLGGLHYLATHPDRRLAVYREIGRWIDAHLPADASVGTLEVGIIGYYARRRIVDFAGLIQPAVHAHMGQDTTYQDTAMWALDRYRPDYLALHSSWFPGWQTSVLTDCQILRSFFAHGIDGSFAVYQCNWTG
jgi:hypothetical protein